MKKSDLRRTARQIGRDKLTAEIAEIYSRAVSRAIAESELFAAARCIGLYHALPDEPDLGAILENYGKKKCLCLPRVHGEEIVFYRYQGEERLSSGSFGIKEPKTDCAQVVQPSDLDLIYVPATAFDNNGYRLGRGKGYYDRYLPQAVRAKRIGVTFGLFPVGELPCDPWDIPMHEVFSATGLTQIPPEEIKQKKEV